MKLDDDKIVAAIELAEMKTSGEIRVHFVKRVKGSVFEHAKKTFEDLGMTKTKERNGILFFIAEQSHQFSILGDIGIHEKVHQSFWDEIRNQMVDQFKNKNMTEGLCRGIQVCGEKLAVYFPRQEDDQNELSNEITRES